MTHDEMIAVIQAHKEGKRIEFNARRLIFPEWLLCREPAWDFSTYDYRIAREPRKMWIRWAPHPDSHICDYRTTAQTGPGWQEVTEKL